MTDQSVGAVPPLGVGQIVGESFSLLFSRIGVFFLLAFIPALLSAVITAAYFGIGYLSGQADPNVMLEAMTSPIGIAILIVLPIIIYGLATALIVCAAYDAKLGRPARIGQYFSIALTRAIPVTLVSIVVSIIVGIGAIFLLIPGLYLLALLSVAVVAVVLESEWFGSLGRSRRLTKEYRWPILGTIILLYLVIVVLQIVFEFISGMLIGVSPILAVVVFAAVNALGSALFSIGFVLIYARLRELKEGVSVDTLANVFS